MSTPLPLATLPAAPRQKPTQVRHIVVFVTFLMSVILYLDRLCVSFAERYIREDLALSESQIAWFLSSFFWSYALAQVPAGWLGDRFGSRGVLALYIVSWSFFTAMIGLAGGVFVLIAMRLGCGVGQAGAYPTAASILSRWVPFSARAFASGLVGLGGRVGAVIAPMLTAYLMVFFVPPSTPAEVDPRTILNGPALCGRLLPPDAKTYGDDVPIESRLQELLPEDAQWVVTQYGALYQNYERMARAVSAESDRLATGGVPPDLARQKLDHQKIDEQLRELKCRPEDLVILCAGINQLLSQPELFSVADFEQLKRSPEREAFELVERRRHGETLSDRESLRLNRLVLESIFPREVGKLYVKGWRPVLVVYGLAGLLIAAVFWVCFRNSPAEHPRCNAAEQELIAGAGPPTAGDAQPAMSKFPTRELFRNLSLWLSCINQFTTNAAWLFFVTSLPRYLMEIHHVPILERSWMASIPPLAGIAGTFLGGHLTDVITRRVGLRWGRALPMGLTRFLAAGAYLACLSIESPWMATAAFAAGFFFVDLGVSAVWAYMQDVGGKQVGAIHGWGNMWGNFGAAVAPQLFNSVLGANPVVADWNRMFVVCAGLFVVAGLAGLGVNASVPLATNEQPASEES